MNFVFLSPHLDDAVLSCGGLIWELVRQGSPVEIWTVFAGDARLPLSDYAQTLHRRWDVHDDGVQVRRAEDRAASDRLGATARHFSLPDVIYRRFADGRPVVQADEDLFQPLPAPEEHLVAAIQDQLAVYLPKDVTLVVPLTLGGHIDHRLVRLAAERVPVERWYYADYPYVAIHQLSEDRFAGADWQTREVDISESGLQAWQEAAACYRSQISTFWDDTGTMAAELRQYWSSGGGRRLWRPVTRS